MKSRDYFIIAISSLIAAAILAPLQESSVEEEPDPVVEVEAQDDVTLTDSDMSELLKAVSKYGDVQVTSCKEVGDGYSIILSKHISGIWYPKTRAWVERSKR